MLKSDVATSTPRTWYGRLIKPFPTGFSCYIISYADFSARTMNKSITQNNQNDKQISKSIRRCYCQVIVGSFFHTDFLMLPYPGLLAFCLLKSCHCKQFFSVSAYCSFQSHHMPDYRVFISFPVFLWGFR